MVKKLHCVWLMPNKKKNNSGQINFRLYLYQQQLLRSVPSVKSIFKIIWTFQNRFLLHTKTLQQIFFSIFKSSPFFFHNLQPSIECGSWRRFCYFFKFLLFSIFSFIFTLLLLISPKNMKTTTVEMNFCMNYYYN